MSALTRASVDDQLIQMWLHDRPKATNVSYSHTVADFLQFVNKSLNAIALEDLQSYVTRLHDQNLKESSIRTKLNAIKSLFSFAAKLNYVRFNVAAALKMPKSNYSLAGRILKQTDILRLINAAKPGRDRALLRFIYSTGVRVSEVCRLVWGDFNERDSGEVQVKILGKGNKIRVVLVPAVVWVEVEALKGSDTDSSPVFPSSSGNPIDRTAVHRIVKECAMIAGINPKISTHWLRHAHAQHSLSKGAPIHLVRDSLGHSNISVTNVYLESNPTDSSSNYLGL